MEDISLFEGTLIHSANWPRDFDYTNKKVAVIGNGASGVQIVPAMRPREYIPPLSWRCSQLTTSRREEATPHHSDAHHDYPSSRCHNEDGAFSSSP